MTRPSRPATCSAVAVCAWRRARPARPVISASPAISGGVPITVFPTAVRRHIAVAERVPACHVPANTVVCAVPVVESVWVGAVDGVVGDEGVAVPTVGVGQVCAFFVGVGRHEAAQRAGVVALLGVLEAGGDILHIPIELAVVVVPPLHLLAEGRVAGRLGARLRALLRVLLRAPGAGRSQPVGDGDISSRLRQALAKVDVGLDDAEGEVAGGIRRQSICREIPGPMVEGEALLAVGRPRPDAQVLVVVAIPLRPIDAVHPDQPVLRIVVHMQVRQQNDVAVGVVIGAVVQHPVGHWVVPRLVRVAQTLGHVLAGPVAKVVVLVDTFRLGKITI